MKTTFLLLTSQEAVLPCGVDSKASGEVSTPWQAAAEPLPQPQNTSPSLQASGFSLGTGLSPHPASGTPPTPPQAHAPYPISPVTPASAASLGSGSPLSTLHGFTWGTEYLSCTCTTKAPLTVWLLQAHPVLLLPVISLKQSLSHHCPA